MGFVFHDTYLQASIAGVFGIGWVLFCHLRVPYSCPLIYIGDMYIIV